MYSCPAWIVSIRRDWQMRLISRWADILNISREEAARKWVVSGHAKEFGDFFCKEYKIGGVK